MSRRRDLTAAGPARPRPEPRAPMAWWASPYSSARPSAHASQVNCRLRHRPRSTSASTSDPPSRTRSDGAGQAVAVAGVDHQGPVADHLGNRTGRGGHHRDAGRHGLEGREAESLVEGRVGQQPRPRPGWRPGRGRRDSRGAGSGPGPARRPPRRSPARPPIRPPPPPPGPPPGGRRPPPRRRAPAAGSPCVVRRCRWPGRTGCTRRAVGAAPPGLAPGRGRGPAGSRGTPARTRSGSTRELGDHLVGHEPRRGVHPRPLGHRPPDEAGELEGGRFAQLRVEHHGEVVDGHHPGGRPVGGTTKLVPWTTSWGPMNHSTGGHGARPHDACRGRAGMARCRVETPGGDQRLDAPPTTPADGEGRHIEVRQGGQAGQRAGAEPPTPVGSTKQRCGIESDGQPARVRRVQIAPGARSEPCTSPADDRDHRDGPHGPDACAPHPAGPDRPPGRRHCGARPTGQAGNPTSAPMIAALAGGVGAARLLRGMVEVIPPASITAIVNTGDDTVLHGLHIAPDLDTVMYTLADAINPETGWGLAGETWRVMESLERLGRDHLVQPRRSGPGHPLLPDPAAGRGGGA